MNNHPQESGQKTVKMELAEWTTLIGPMYGPLVAVAVFTINRKYLPKLTEEQITQLTPDSRLARVHETAIGNNPSEYQENWPIEWIGNI